MNTKQSKVIIWLLELIIICVVIFNCPSSLTHDKASCYYVICVQLFIIWLVNVYISNKYYIDIIEPVFLVTVIHIMMFEITPLICLWTNDISWFGVDLWGGCIKGSILSTLSYLCIIFAYYRSRWKAIEEEEDCWNELISYGSSHNCLLFNIIVWCVAFLSNVYLMMTSGKSLGYILTLGLGNSVDDVTTTTSVGFLGVIAYAMIPAYLYIFALSKSRLLKIITFYLMTVSFMVRGFRFILVTVILSPLVLICIQKRKRPKTWQLVGVLFLLFFMIGFLGIVRGGIRTGKGLSEFSMSSLSAELVYDIILDNFSIVKTYYGIVLNIPNEMGYTLGRQIILYTAIMLIPRAVWLSKPQPILRDVISASVTEYSARAGTAYPYVGEYYHEFGIFGVIVLSLILGKLLGRLKCYMFKSDIHSQIVYATVFPLVFQILIRGYTPSNFYMIVFVILPVIISKNM